MVAVLSDTVSNTATMLMPSAQKNQTSLRQEMSQNREFHSFCHRYSTFASACESGSGSAWGTGAGSAWGSGAGAHPQAAQPHGLLRQSTLQCKGIAPVHLSRLPAGCRHTASTASQCRLHARLPAKEVLANDLLPHLRNRGRLVLGVATSCRQTDYAMT